MDIVAAFTVAIELYWMHNIAYHPKLKHMFSVLEYVLKISKEAHKGVLVSKFVNAVTL